jgi:hypothetical protein
MKYRKATARTRRRLFLRARIGGDDCGHDPPFGYVPLGADRVAIRGTRLKYVLEIFARRPDEFAPDELKRIHELSRAPVIRDGDDLLAESGAIAPLDW